jgi:hypothetical protein
MVKKQINQKKKGKNFKKENNVDMTKKTNKIMHKAKSKIF